MLNAAQGRVVVKVDLQAKNFHTFSDGNKIRLERDFDNFDNRYVKPVNATVISGGDMPEGAEIICHHNSVCETNKINNYKPLSGEDISSEIGYYSIPDTECYIWRKDSAEWNACKGFAIGERVFEPYKGIIEGIEPTKIKDQLYIKTGELAGKVCVTLHASDYEMIFQDLNGQESRIVRCRHFEDKNLSQHADERERQYNRGEIVAIHEENTARVKKGDLLIGLSPSDARKLN